MTEPVGFRDADPDDLDRMSRAQRETAGLTYDEAPTDQTFAALARRTRLALESVDPTHHRIRVAVPPVSPSEPDAPEGLDITYAWIEQRAGDTAFLVDFYVAGPERGSPRADELFDEMLAVARSWGCRRLEFRVGRNNQRAQRYFRRRGATLWPTPGAERGPRAFSLSLVAGEPITGQS